MSSLLDGVSVALIAYFPSTMNWSFALQISFRKDRAAGLRTKPNPARNPTIWWTGSPANEHEHAGGDDIDGFLPVLSAIGVRAPNTAAMRVFRFDARALFTYRCAVARFVIVTADECVDLSEEMIG
ncbi:hypothetical protein E1202_25710 [Saccharopolyspora karakumensis]|uniref:Uncharacterized protein n=1 Tax=Saccharopolyspora karakumensis TaxID=2530386 RepID=A0A4R5BA52_9PSEU|nr:hypothetical protein [Saccharopolyspora karakumensis]TDD83248.1 hypothetical protein E1202_25710 [Saccharopolyspora karakumensis]